MARNISSSCQSGSILAELFIRGSSSRCSWTTKCIACRHMIARRAASTWVMLSPPWIPMGLDLVLCTALPALLLALSCDNGHLTWCFDISRSSAGRQNGSARTFSRWRRRSLSSIRRRRTSGYGECHFPHGATREAHYALVAVTAPSTYTTAGSSASQPQSGSASGSGQWSTNVSLGRR